jgi:hypothetical protein
MTALLPEMAHGTFRPLLERLDKDEKGPKPAPDRAREIVAGCEFAAVVVEGLGEVLHRALGEGVEGEKLRLFVKDLAEVVALVLQVYARTAEVTQALSPGEASEARRKLEQDSALARDLLGELTELQTALDQPPPSVDPASLTAGRAGSYERLEDVLARLQAGDDL